MFHLLFKLDDVIPNFQKQFFNLTLSSINEITAVVSTTIHRLNLSSNTWYNTVRKNQGQNQR